MGTFKVRYTFFEPGIPLRSIFVSPMQKTNNILFFSFGSKQSKKVCCSPKAGWLDEKGLFKKQTTQKTIKQNQTLWFLRSRKDEKLHLFLTCPGNYLNMKSGLKHNRAAICQPLHLHRQISAGAEALWGLWSISKKSLALLQWASGTGWTSLKSNPPSKCKHTILTLSRLPGGYMARWHSRYLGDLRVKENVAEYFGHWNNFWVRI